MSQPAVNISELDGSVGQVSGGLDPMVVIGVCSSGAVDTPTPLSRVVDLISTFGDGPAVEAAAYQIEVKNHPVVMVRTGQTTAGDYQDVTGGGNDETIQTGSGTSVATTAVVTEPLGNFKILIEVLTGGIVGTAGIEYRYSLDGGSTFSGTLALGTAVAIALPALPTGGVTINLTNGAGETLVAGDTIYLETRAPAPNSTEVGTAFDALKVYGGSIEQVHCAFPIDATIFDVIATKESSFRTAGRPINWFGNFRLPDYGETEAAYLAAYSTAMGSKATTYGCLTAGSAAITSGVSSRKYVQPVSVAVAAEHSNVQHHINVADPNRGALAGVSIRDANSNPLYHDETANPGLDDARATVLRTWGSPQGVYVNRPRIFSASGSDFYLVPHRRVMNLAFKTLLAYFVRRLNQPVRVSTSTGFILEAEALEIEAGGDAVLRAALMATPKASGGGFSRGRFVQLSRTDNLLTTKTLTGQARIVPLAYPEFVNLDLGFFNPALQTV